jgi:ribosomal protein L31
MPVLQQPDMDRGFILYTDASDMAISGVLSQASLEDSKQIHPIYYGSRTLTDAERKWSTYEREFLAVVYFVNFFRNYLLGRKFTLYTDHHALRYCLKLREDAHFRIVRGLIKLVDFDFDILYRPGRQNQNADVLSRITVNVTPDDHTYSIGVIQQGTTADAILQGQDYGLDDLECDQLVQY